MKCWALTTKGHHIIVCVPPGLGFVVRWQGVEGVGGGVTKVRERRKCNVLSD